MLQEFFQVFFSFLVIMDPFASAVYFLNISKKFTEAEKKDAVNAATLVAGATLLLFLAVGPVLLSILGVSTGSFQIAGGVILFIISVNFVLGGVTEKERKLSRNASIMIIGVPLITGPGVLTTTIMMAGAYGHLITLSASAGALAVVWLILRLSERIHGLIGERGMEISSRIMGLLLAAIAVEFIKKGVLTVV
jgi:multiple antibiotic resistance protein